MQSIEWRKAFSIVHRYLTVPTVLTHHHYHSKSHFEHKLLGIAVESPTLWGTNLMLYHNIIALVSHYAVPFYGYYQTTWMLLSTKHSRESAVAYEHMYVRLGKTSSRSMIQLTWMVFLHRRVGGWTCNIVSCFTELVPNNQKTAHIYQPWSLIALSLEESLSSHQHSLSKTDDAGPAALSYEPHIRTMTSWEKSALLVCTKSAGSPGMGHFDLFRVVAWLRF